MDKGVTQAQGETGTEKAITTALEGQLRIIQPTHYIFIYIKMSKLGTGQKSHS